MQRILFLFRFCALIAVLIVANHTAYACLNGSDADVFGRSQSKSRSQYPLPLGYAIDLESPRLVQSLTHWQSAEESQHFESMTNLGIYYVFNHQYEEAETQFRKNAAQWPDRYESAANLGTILEINGKNAEALTWIKQSLVLNPTAHDSSEWIHVKIIEGKLNPGLPFESETILGVSFGDQVMPKATLNKRGLKLLQKQLFLQLNERISFIPPQDDYVASLMYALGNVTMSVGQYEMAYKIYRLASAYGCVEPLIKERTKFAKKES